MVLAKRHLIVQSQQWKHQNDVWNLFKVTNKYNRTMQMMSYITSYKLFI